MRMKAHDNIWIFHGGKWWAGEFLGYAGRGLVKTNSDAGYCLRVPRNNIKTRRRKEVSA